MKKSGFRFMTAFLLAMITLLLAACTAAGVETSTEGATKGDTELVTDGATTDGAATTEQITADETEDATEAETEPPVEVVIPEGELPDILHLLQGETLEVREDHSMKNVTLSSLKNSGVFVSTGGTLLTKGAEGLTAVNTNWDALGFAAPVSTDTYTAEVQFSVGQNNRGGDFNAAMVGLFCKTAENLFIDGGLWFSFRQNRVSIYVKGGFEKVLDSSLPFDAADGIHFIAQGNREGVTVYANDSLIATVSVTNQGITVLNAKGAEVGKTDLTHLSVDGNGYFRYMTHYANSTLSSMKLTGETKRAYAPEEKVFSFLADTPYAFMDKAQYLAELPSTVYGETLYADGFLLGELFGFECAADGDTFTLSRDQVTLTFKAGIAEVQVNGEAYPFPTTVQREDVFLLAVAHMGELMGYQPQQSEGMTVVTTENHLTQEVMHMAQERFELYRDVVYNYDDVDCDQRGVGEYEPVPYEERLVGIAYTTWHRPGTKWGDTHTWDLPLYGPYNSDDEAVIRRHGEQLRDAGVDFVFVDWSNNTEYVPETMREHRPDFRMIEEATDKLFDIWATIEGAPKICIFVGPGHNGPTTITSGAHQAKVDQVWEDYVNNPARQDMYFYYDGKPLLICYGATPNQYTAKPQKLWDDSRFTVRWMTGYVGQQTYLHRPRNLESTGFWSWEERVAQTFTVYNNQVEAVTVSASTRSQGTDGENGYIPAAGRENGATLKKQFQRACDLGAKFVLIVSWNEWTTSEQPTAEISKDIEPSQLYGTFYYDLMREQIRKFKGQVQQ